MIDAAIKALQQMFSPPFRSVLIKSVLLALVMIVLIGVGLQKGLTFLTASGSTWAEGSLGAGSHDSLAWIVWLVSIATSLGIILGGVFLMPAVTAFVGSFFVDEVAEQVERVHYPADPAGKALPILRGATEGLKIALVSVAVYLCALPFIFLAGLGLFILFFASAYLLSREYFELAAMRFRPVAEAKAFRKANHTAVFTAGLLIAAFVSIPIVNLATPLFAMAFMVHMHKKLSQRALIEARR
jgi:CysZ protein